MVRRVEIKPSHRSIGRDVEEEKTENCRHIRNNRNKAFDENYIVSGISEQGRQASSASGKQVK